MWTYLLTTLIGLALVYLFFFKKPSRSPRIRMGPRPTKLAKQTREVSPKKPGEGAIRRGSEAPDGELLSTLKGGRITTLYQSFQNARSNYGAYPCLGTRSFESDGSRGHYHWKSYMDIANKRNHFAAGLTNLGVKPNDRVGIYSKNREEWIITEQACYASSFVIVSFYDTLGEEAVEYICNHSEARVVICSKESTPKMLAVRHKCPNLEIIIQMEKVDAEQAEQAKAKNVKMISFDEVLKDGQANPHDGQKPNPDDLCTIMYTSGTTGDPKGVLITHKNVVAVMAAAEQLLDGLLAMGDSYLSYLPLAHIFERAVVNVALYRGCRIGFYQGDVRKIIDDVAELKPAFFSGVPRVFDRIHDKINNMVAQGGPIKAWLFQKALAASEESIRTGKPVWWVWDKLVLSKVRARLGGNVAAMLSGSAPLTTTVQQFMRVAFGCPVMQGYGLTETCAGATISWPRDSVIGHTGTVLSCCEIKLVDVPEMGYTSDGDVETGEIVIRGPNVSQGYYKDPKKTAEDFVDGWFHTGDIGRWNKDGTLSIIDRKKNIFKLSQGEYVAAEKLEGVFSRSKYIAQIWVYGDSTKFALVAVAYPDPETLLPWAKENGLPADMVALCKNKKVQDMILKDINDVGRQAKLRGFELIQRVLLTPEEFSIEKNLVTPTFKLRRPQLRDYFSAGIEKMYAEIDAAAAACSN